MQSIQVKFHNDFGQLMDYDYRGQIIPEEKRERYGLHVPLSFVLDDTELNSVIDVWIKKKDCPPERQIREFAFVHAATGFSKWLSRAESFNAFSSMNEYSWLPIDKGTYQQTFDKSALHIVQNVNVHDVLYESLKVQKEKDLVARRRFGLAKHKLYEFADANPAYISANESVIRMLLSYIEAVYRETENRFLAAWLQEKLPRLRNAFNELCHRTQVNNRNFKFYADDARTISYDLREPFCWYTEPSSEENIDQIVGM